MDCQKCRLVFNMFQNVKKEHKVKLSLKLWQSLMNIVAIQRPGAAYVLSKGEFIQFESLDWNAVVLLDISLQ